MSYNNKNNEVILSDIKNDPIDIENCYQQLLNLFRDNGVDRIQQLVEDSITDQDLLFQILDQALGVLNDSGHREKFKKYFSTFKQNMGTISSEGTADPYEIPIKEFGQISTIMQRLEIDNSQKRDPRPRASADPRRMTGYWQDLLWRGSRPRTSRRPT